jgi:hypothetical protein
VTVLIALATFTTALVAAPDSAGVPPAAIDLTSTTVTNPQTVIASDTANAGSFGVERVLCPEGMVALSGGIDMHNVATMKVTSSGPVFEGSDERLINRPNGSNPASVGWQASALNEGASAGIFRVAVVCARLTGASTMVASDTAPLDSFATERVLCPPGEAAVGGGIDLDNVLTMEGSSSAPSFGGSESRLLLQDDGLHDAPIGWQASALNRAGSSQSFKVAAVCAPLSEVTTMVGSDTANAGGLGVERQLCPAGQVALGGGVDNENVLTMQVSSSAPTFDGDTARLIYQGSGRAPAPNGWQVSSVNDIASAQTLKIAAVCAEAVYEAHLPLVTRGS